MPRFLRSIYYTHLSSLPSSCFAPFASVVVRFFYVLAVPSPRLPLGAPDRRFISIPSCPSFTILASPFEETQNEVAFIALERLLLPCHNSRKNYKLEFSFSFIPDPPFVEWNSIQRQSYFNFDAFSSNICVDSLQKAVLEADLITLITYAWQLIPRFRCQFVPFASSRFNRILFLPHFFLFFLLGSFSLLHPWSSNYYKLTVIRVSSRRTRRDRSAIMMRW